MNTCDSKIQKSIDNIGVMAKKNQLFGLIRFVGVYHREDPVFLAEYAKEQVALWSDTPERLEQAIACFQSEKDKLLCKKSSNVY